MLLTEQIANDPEWMKEFQRERLEVEVTESICQLMSEQKVTKAELARRLGKSRAYVSKLLATGNNMTLNTVSDIFCALGRSPRVLARPLSMWTQPMLVMEIPHASRSPVPTSNIRIVSFGQRPSSAPSSIMQPASGKTGAA